MTDGTFILPSDILVIRHVLYTDPTFNGKYIALNRKGINDFIVNDIAASGTPTNWALIGFVSAGQSIRIWPAPQQSAASGIYIIGSEVPQPFSISASTVPVQIRDMVPLQAAIACWQTRGATEEIARLTQIYDTRLSAWRMMMVDMGLDEQDSMEWGTFETAYPHAGTLRPVALTPNPLWP